jgi:hypothetical protein
VAGAIATTSTTMPTPPNHCMVLRQRRIASGSDSTCLSSVAPVVVKPLMLSKKASPGRPNVPSTRNGTAPTIAAASQAAVTAKNPSRARSGIAGSRLADRIPAAAAGITAAAGAPKASAPPSPPTIATAQLASNPNPTASSAPEMTGTISCQLRFGPTRPRSLLTRR